MLFYHIFNKRWTMGVYDSERGGGVGTYRDGTHHQKGWVGHFGEFRKVPWYFSIWFKRWVGHSPDFRKYMMGSISKSTDTPLRLKNKDI
ncbi:MAG: hypothetical protein GY820_44235 [Gammaproteobacteria bacterium]|nr:hypothetical protein [Gammaproteobacteria bacterium]